MGISNSLSQVVTNPFQLDRLAKRFHALGEPTRLKIMELLSQGEKSVGTLAEILGMSQPSVSHHLKTLRLARFARTRRQGKQIFYSINDGSLGQMLSEGVTRLVAES